MNTAIYIRSAYWLTFIYCTHSVNLYAQLPACLPSDTLIYYTKTNDSKIFSYNPEQPLSPANPGLLSIYIPAASAGLALANNINGGSPSPTFYTTIRDTVYYYYADTTWINTGHTLPAVNLGMGGGYLFALNGTTGEVYRYDGTEDAKLITTIHEFDGVNVGPFDCFADCEGNFFILRISSESTEPRYFRKYDANGSLLHEWKVLADSSNFPAGGMTIINNYVYIDGLLGRGKGYVSGDNFILKHATPYLLTNDYTSCNVPYTTGKAKANTDTVFICPGTNTATFFSTVEAEGDIVTWSIISGSATLLEDGDTANVQASGPTTVLLTVSGLTGCSQTSTDTVVIIPVTASVNAGTDKTLMGCNEYNATLSATLTDTIAGIVYKKRWAPLNNITVGAQTLHPTVTMQQGTTYVITITTALQQGGCTWSDSVYLAPEKYVKAIAQVTDSLLCPGDTTQLSAASSVIYPSGHNARYTWHLADGRITEGLTTTQVYHTINSHKIILVVTDTANCADTAYTQVEVYNCNAWIPGVFSPNGDGLNDIFRMRGDFANGLTEFEFAIFNRFGERVFQTKDVTRGWDGTYKGAPAPVGTFYYYIKYSIRGGSPQMLKGDVALIR